MTEAILSHPRLELIQKIAIVKAIGKVIWIQNDLMAKWHVDDGRGFSDDGDEAGTEAEALEPEGYVSGKRILGQTMGNGDDSSIVSSTSLETSTTSLGRSIEQVRLESEQQSKCPFNGVTAAADDMDKQRTAACRPHRRELAQSEHIAPPSGIPRLHVIDGMTFGKEKLDPNPFK
jgi:hypothetical protein